MSKKSAKIRKTKDDDTKDKSTVEIMCETIMGDTDEFGEIEDIGEEFENDMPDKAFLLYQSEYDDYPQKFLNLDDLNEEINETLQSPSAMTEPNEVIVYKIIKMKVRKYGDIFLTEDI